MTTKTRRLMTQPDLPGYGPYENREDYEEKQERRAQKEYNDEMRAESDFGWEHDVVDYLKQKGELPNYD